MCDSIGIFCKQQVTLECTATCQSSGHTVDTVLDTLVWRQATAADGRPSPDDNEDGSCCIGRRAHKFIIVDAAASRSERFDVTQLHIHPLLASRCKFCHQFNSAFQRREFRENHYALKCPMLTVCEHCHMVRRRILYNRQPDGASVDAGGTLLEALPNEPCDTVSAVSTVP